MTSPLDLHLPPSLARHWQSVLRGAGFDISRRDSSVTEAEVHEVHSLTCAGFNTVTCSVGPHLTLDGWTHLLAIEPDNRDQSMLLYIHRLFTLCGVPEPGPIVLWRRPLDHTSALDAPLPLLRDFPCRTEPRCAPDMVARDSLVNDSLRLYLGTVTNPDLDVNVQYAAIDFGRWSIPPRQQRVLWQAGDRYAAILEHESWERLGSL